MLFITARHPPEKGAARMDQAKTEQPGANVEVRIGATVVAPSGSPSISSAADSMTFDAMLAWLASGEGILTALAVMAAIGLAGLLWSLTRPPSS
jgi:hypothetical protein